jgi:large subunit ribosomal protein L15
MQLDRMKPAPGSRRVARRIGRGPGSGWGKTSGKGHKGARARTGFVDKPGFEGGQMPMARRLPKRGFHNVSRIDYQVVNLRDLGRFDAGSVVDVPALASRGLVSGRSPVKVLAKGKLERGLTVRANAFSEAARRAIEAAGGAVEVVAAPGARPSADGKRAGGKKDGQS